MFPNLQLEVLDRFTAVEQFFRKSPKGPISPANVSQISKGLAFVQIYAVYEYTVREVTRTAIKEIADHGHAYAELRSPLLAVFLDSEMKSLLDCGDKDKWIRRLGLLERATSTSPITAVDAMPHDGTHFRHSQVKLILKTLGVSRSFTYRKRHLYMIDQVVDNRNAIAHGDEPAEIVGRRYSRAEIHKTIRIMKGICLRLINVVSEHCRTPASHRR